MNQGRYDVGNKEFKHFGEANAAPSRPSGRIDVVSHDRVTVVELTEQL